MSQKITDQDSFKGAVHTRYAETHADRLGKILRENLKKRKLQQRQKIQLKSKDINSLNTQPVISEGN